MTLTLASIVETPKERILEITLLNGETQCMIRKSNAVNLLTKRKPKETGAYCSTVESGTLSPMYTNSTLITDLIYVVIDMT